MAKFKVKYKGCQLQVRAKLGMKEKLDVRQLEYFSSKYIRGLLKARFIKNNLVEYYGPIGISLHERMKKPINKYDFLFIMEQIVDVVQKLNLNTLIVGNVCFDIKNVYINETTKELQFIYLPLQQLKGHANVLDFMQQIIYEAHPLQEADMGYISRFVYFIKNQTQFDADKIEQYILSEDRNVVNTIKRHNVGQSGFMTDKPADYYAHYNQKNEEATGLLPDEEATGLLQDEATGLLNDEATGLLNEEATGLLVENIRPVCYAKLFRIATNEEIIVNKTVFRLGKERSNSDYAIADNDVVSRNHADFIVRNGRYYIMDLNSKNRTFVNNNPIPPQQEIEIYVGDIIKLANEEFVLRN